MKQVIHFVSLFLLIFILGSILPNQTLAESGFAIHFLDVGQGDAAIIICDGEVLMIDGGSPGKSDFMYSYLKNTLQIEHIDYMIASHPHDDHIGGLSGALNACTVGKVYSPVLEYDSRAFSSFRKYTEKQGLHLTVPIAGESFPLGSSVVQILGPVQTYDSMNDMSIVVRIVYGETSFLFTGDTEWDAEHDLVDSGYDLSATLLKVPHHGSDTSSSYVFLREVMPEYAIISVGDGNSYGHPSEAVLSRLHDAESQIFRTDLSSSVICHSDGINVSISTEGV